MSVTDAETAFVAAAAASINLAQMFAVSASTATPTYLIVSALDRAEYTVAASGSTGRLTGNGKILPFSAMGGDGGGAGIIFTYQASTGRYYNVTYGYFDQLTYNASSSAGDVTNIVGVRYRHSCHRHDLCHRCPGEHAIWW